MKLKTSWDRGDKKKLAAAVGISPQYLTEILHDRKRCSSPRAIALEREARKLNYKITKFQWSFPMLRTGNPLFPAIAGGEK